MPPKLFQLITFIGSVTRNIHVRFLSGEALRALFPEVLLICIHMNLPKFISFTYEKLEDRQNFGGRRRNREALEDFESFCFILFP